MLFLVISTPRPERPSTLTGNRSRYWDWINPLLESKRCRSVYAKAGRGAVALFDVDSHLTLHTYLNEWADIMPAHFEVLPLLEAEEATAFIAMQATTVEH